MQQYWNYLSLASEWLPEGCASHWGRRNTVHEWQDEKEQARRNWRHYWGIVRKDFFLECPFFYTARVSVTYVYKALQVCEWGSLREWSPLAVAATEVNANTQLVSELGPWEKASLIGCPPLSEVQWARGQQKEETWEDRQWKAELDFSNPGGRNGRFSHQKYN